MTETDTLRVEHGYAIREIRGLRDVEDAAAALLRALPGIPESDGPLDVARRALVTALDAMPRARATGSAALAEPLAARLLADLDEEQTVHRAAVAALEEATARITELEAENAHLRDARRHDLNAWKHDPRGPVT